MFFTPFGIPQKVVAASPAAQQNRKRSTPQGIDTQRMHQCPLSLDVVSRARRYGQLQVYFLRPVAPVRPPCTEPTQPRSALEIAGAQGAVSLGTEPGMGETFFPSYVFGSFEVGFERTVLETLSYATAAAAAQVSEKRGKALHDQVRS